MGARLSKKRLDATKKSEPGRNQKIRAQSQPERKTNPLTHGAMSLADTLRKACAANGLGVSGSADQLLARLFRGGKSAKVNKPKKSTSTSCGKSKAGKPKADKPKAGKPKAGKPKKACAGGVCKKPTGAIKKKAQTKRPMFKATKAGGMRLSASSYFYDMCDGKISRCTPQPIEQPDGSIKIKTIRIVQGAHGKQPRWVLV